MDKQDTKPCPACGGELERKLRDLSIGADGRGGVLALFYDQYEVDLYACPLCGKVELYTAEPSRTIDQPERELVTCPVCDNAHSPLIGCPTCALRNSRPFRLGPASPSTAKKHKRKPPWER